MALPVNFKDDVLASSMDGKRRYNMITNSDGTVSFEDVTTYSQEGSNFGSAQINNTNGEINKINNNVLDTIEEISANTSGGKFAGALALKNVNNSIGDILGFTNDTYDSIGTYIQYCVDNGYLPDPNLIALIPTMTSNTTPSGVVSAINADSNYPAYYAFDNNNDTAWWSKSTSNGWIAYKFPSAKCVTKALLIPTYDGGGARVKNYKIQASNDGNNWITLYTGVCNNLSDEQIVTFKNATSYTNYRIFVVDNYVANGGISIKTVQLYGK